MPRAQGPCTPHCCGSGGTTSHWLPTATSLALRGAGWVWARTSTITAISHSDRGSSHGRFRLGLRKHLHLKCVWRAGDKGSGGRRGAVRHDGNGTSLPSRLVRLPSGRRASPQEHACQAANILHITSKLCAHIGSCMAQSASPYTPQPPRMSLLPGRGGRTHLRLQLLLVRPDMSAATSGQLCVPYFSTRASRRLSSCGA